MNYKHHRPRVVSVAEEFGRIFVLLMLLPINGFVCGATVVVGNSENTTQSFSFPIGSFVFNPQVAALFVGASDSTPENFTVAFNGRASNNFVGITPPIVTLNNELNQANPLYNTVVTNLSLVGTSPIVTTTTDVASLYVIQNFNDLNQVSVLSATNINGADGNVIEGILALGSNAITPITSSSLPSFILSVVTPNAGTFGFPGSGVAVAVLKKVQNASSEQFELTLENAVTGTAGNLAYPLDASTPNLKITDDLVDLSDPILYFDEYTKLFFAGFLATAEQGPSSGARGVLRITSYPQIQFGDIARASAIGPDSIIGTSTPGGTVNIFDVKTMLTSTNLEYLVVRGGTSLTGTLSRQIYALPMVNLAGDSYGALAAKNSLPVNAFNSTKPHVFQGRTYVTPATAPDQLFTSTETPAMVGGGEVPEDVNFMIIKNDAVAVAADNGIYISQALFDIYGRITQWTPWSRAGGTVADVFHIAIENETGDFLYSTGSSSSTINTVLRTGWTNSNIFAQALVPFFAKDTAGIQGFFNYPNVAVTYGGSGTASSCCIATGYNQVSLIQTGNGTPITSLAAPFVSSNGTLNGFAPGIQQIAVFGGDLASIGAIISAAFVQNGSQAWLFVGGTGGLAVLADDNGAGIDSTTGIGNGLSNLRSTMQFRKVGNYSNVRKLVPFNQVGSRGNGSTIQDLYIVSSNTLERAAISQAALAVGGTWNSSVLASTSSLGAYSSLSDVLISAPLALLATSRGLLRSGNGVDISVATTQADVDWTAVPMPESPGTVTRLSSFSPTSVASDFVNGGNMYAFAAAVSTSQARIYRYVVTLTDSIVTDSTVQLFPDYFIAQPANPTQGRQSFLMSVGNYRNYFYTNGANYYFMRSAYVLEEPLVNLITQQITTGAIGLGLKQSPILRALGYRAMGQLVPLSPTGALVAYGDFGLQVNE